MNYFSKKYWVSLIITSLYFAPPTWAEDYINSSLRDVERHVFALNTSPNETLVVLDVDGTLTNYGVPNDHIVAPRGNSVQFVKDLVKNNYVVSVSSAWNVFEETLGRLDKIGLKEALKTDDKNITSGFRNIRVKEEEITLAYFHSGLAASVQNIPKDITYFRGKAFSAMFTAPDVDLSSIKHVIFADDSRGNIKRFKEDAEKYELFPNATIDTFALSLADGQENLD